MVQSSSQACLFVSSFGGHPCKILSLEQKKANEEGHPQSTCKSNLETQRHPEGWLILNKGVGKKKKKKKKKKKPDRCPTPKRPKDEEPILSFLLLSRTENAGEQ